MKSKQLIRARRIKNVVLITSVLLLATLSVFAVNKAEYANKTIQHTLNELESGRFQDGDIIFQSSQSGQSLAIQLATHSKYSHVGMLFQRDDKWMVLEAVQPVKATPFKQWIQHGDDQHYVVKRLKNAKKILTPEVLEDMKAIAESWVGKNYDLHFDWSDERIYCSELVWKIYHRTTGLSVGKTQKFKEFDFDHPEVQRILKARYGEDLPLESTVISPGAIFESDLLFEVDRN